MAKYTLLALLPMFVFSDLMAQNSLKWVIEGSLYSNAHASGTIYSFRKNDIANSAYTEGVDPFLWGYMIITSSVGVDTLDFEVVVESNFAGSTERQLTVYHADSSMDLQTDFQANPLSQEVRLQFNIFEYQSRTNTAFNSGSGGVPQNAIIGFTAPNENITSIARLHTAEVYYIESIGTTAPISCTTLDPCSQIDTYVTGLLGADIESFGEDINGTALNTAKTNGTYPYNKTGGRTYIHAMERQNTCDANNNNQLEFTEANYNVIFEPLNSFIVGRRDIQKSAGNGTGRRSAIGFYLAPHFDILPVEMSVFKGQFLNTYNELHWVTRSETNNDYFVIEHSSDGITWTNAGVVKSTGNHGTSQFYSFLDYKFYPGVTYYRLKQVDFDGSYSYSKVLAIKTTKLDANPIQIFPNPTADFIHIKGQLSHEFRLRIYNTSKQLVMDKNISLRERISIEQLPEGVYILQIIDKNSVMVTRKIVKTSD